MEERGFLFFEPILALLILGLMSVYCENIPQDWCNFPVEVTEENKEQLYEIRGIKMMSMFEAYRGCGLSVCRNQREFEPGPCGRYGVPSSADALES